MPATVEALLIALIFITPGFLTVRTREMLVPSVGRPDGLQITLRSITISLMYLPLWLVAARDLILLRQRLSGLTDGSVATVSVLDRGRDLLLGGDTKMFKDGEEKKDLVTSGGEAVWIPGAEVTSIDVHE